MIRFRNYILIILLIGLTSAGIAQVDVALPELEVAKGDTIHIPLSLGDFDAHEIYSCLAVVEYRAEILTPLGASTDSATIAEDWAAPVVNIDSLGIFKLALYGAEPLDSSGTLVFLHFEVTGDYGDTTSLHIRNFEFNANHEDDPVAITHDGFVSIFLKPVQVTITTSIGAPTQVLVDGAAYTAPFQTAWHPGSEHEISIEYSQSFAEGVVCDFSSWSDGGNQTHKVAPVSDTTFTADLLTQYLVTINSAHGNPIGAGWFHAGSEVTIQVDSTVSLIPGTRYVFSGWQGRGDGAYTGINNPATFTLSAPVTETAIWQTQFALDVVTLPAGLAEISGSGWYAKGTEATTGKAPAQVGAGETLRDFRYWMVDGVKRTGNPVVVEMDTSHVAAAAYLGYITVNLETNVETGSRIIVDGDTLAAPQKLNWVQGSEHLLNIPDVQLEASGERFIFQTWSDGGTREHTVAPVNDTTFSAQLQQQFQLTVKSEPVGIPEITKSSWRTVNEVVPLVPAPEKIVFQERNLTFLYWLIDATADYNYKISVILDTPKIVTAHYLQDMFIHGSVTAQEIPVPNVKVYLDTTRQDSCTTNENGEFIFEGLTAGEYLVVPLAEGLVFDHATTLIQLTTQSVKGIQLTAVDTQAPLAQVLTPNGGESFNSDEDIAIKWSASDNVKLDSVLLFYSTDAGENWNPIAQVNPADTSYQWPAPVVTSPNCLIRLIVVDFAGNRQVDESDKNFAIGGGAGVKDGAAKQAFTFNLHQNYPNPFNPSTDIVYEMPDDAFISVRIYNLAGQEISTLVEGHQKAGLHRIQWTAGNVTSGIYFCRLQSGSQITTRRMVLAK